MDIRLFVAINTGEIAEEDADTVFGARGIGVVIPGVEAKEGLAVQGQLFEPLVCFLFHRDFLLHLV